MSRRVLITGAAQGIGAGVAKSLAEAGYDVVVSDISGDRLSEVANRLAEHSVQAAALDVRSRADFEMVRDCFGPIDILVNNAAITRAEKFEDVTIESWSEVLDVNLRGAFLGSQTFAPGMADRGWGRIVNLTSLSGQRGGPQVQGPHYSCSKAAIIQLTRYTAFEFASRGVTVNAIAGGPILTPQTALAPKDKLEEITSSIPVGRLGTVEEVGAAICYFADDLSGFVTGSVMDMNGGIQMR